MLTKIQETKAEKDDLLRMITGIRDEANALASTNSLIVYESKIEFDKQLIQEHVTAVESFVKTEIVQLHQTVKRIEENQGEMEKKLTTMEGRLEKIEKHQGEMEKRLTAVEGRLETIEKNQEKMNGRLSTIEQNQLVLWNKHDSFEASITNQLQEILEIVNKK